MKETNANLPRITTTTPKYLPAVVPEKKEEISAINTTEVAEIKGDSEESKIVDLKSLKEKVAALEAKLLEKKEKIEKCTIGEIKDGIKETAKETWNKTKEVAGKVGDKLEEFNENHQTAVTVGVGLLSAGLGYVAAKHNYIEKGGKFVKDTANNAGHFIKNTAVKAGKETRSFFAPSITKEIIKDAVLVAGTVAVTKHLLDKDSCGEGQGNSGGGCSDGCGK